VLECVFPSHQRELSGGFGIGSVLFSVDGGATWTASNLSSGLGRIELAYATASPTTVYASIEDSQFAHSVGCLQEHGWRSELYPGQ